MMIAVVLAAGGAYAGPDGRISVVDGDTIRVGGETVRLFGIDAPEVEQACRRPGGEVWRCGDWARDEVRRLFQGRRATCDRRDTDPELDEYNAYLQALARRDTGDSHVEAEQRP